MPKAQINFRHKIIKMNFKKKKRKSKRIFSIHRSKNINKEIKRIINKMRGVITKGVE